MLKQAVYGRFQHFPSRHIQLDIFCSRSEHSFFLFLLLLVPIKCRTVKTREGRNTMAESSTASSSFEVAEEEALKVSTFRRLHPRVYLERFLSEKVRPDGRELDESRDVTVNVGSYYSGILWTGIQERFSSLARLDIHRQWFCTSATRRNNYYMWGESWNRWARVGPSEWRISWYAA